MWIVSCITSIKEVPLHEQMHKKQKTTPSDIPSEPPSKQSAETVQPPRLRPQRVAARRQKELLCAFQFQELEWMELDDVNNEGLDIPPVSSIKTGTPIIEKLRGKNSLVLLCCSFKKINMFSFQ